MLSSLTKAIDQYSQDLLRSNPFFAKAAQGQLSQKHVAQFLENVRFLITFTVPHLSRAAELAEHRGIRELALAYREEIEEEKGHEKWAEQDLQGLRYAYGVEPSNIVGAAQQLVQYVREQLEADPAILMVYAHFIEALTVRVGPKLITDIESKCGIPAAMLTVISNHLKLDVHHVPEGRKFIADFLKKNPDRVSTFAEVVKKAGELFSNLCTEVLESS